MNRKFIVFEKAVGQTPLEVVEEYKKMYPETASLPMTYAGRLDPMASGQLLVLIGEECKKQKDYHGLDKTYEFEILFGTSSDTGDVLGIVEWKKMNVVTMERLATAARDFVGRLKLPYPHFSSKTVQGKPLHVWTLENRLSEIEIPTADTEVYKIKILNIREVSCEQVYKDVIAKIDTIKPVTEKSKALGRDFRRDDVRMAWKVWYENHRGQNCQIATLEATVSSGTYIRSLAPEIAKTLSGIGLAYSIHRTKIGCFQKLPFGLGFWRKIYR